MTDVTSRVNPKMRRHSDVAISWIWKRPMCMVAERPAAEEEGRFVLVPDAIWL